MFFLLIPAVIFLSGCTTRSTAAAELDRTVLDAPVREPSATPEIIYHTVEFRADDFSLSLQSVEEGSVPSMFMTCAITPVAIPSARSRA